MARVRAPKDHEKEKYTLEKCSENAKFMFAVKDINDGNN